VTKSCTIPFFFDLEETRLLLGLLLWCLGSLLQCAPLLLELLDLPVKLGLHLVVITDELQTIR